MPSLSLRILALDVGERRIGVAAGDAQYRVAIPITTLELRGDPIETVAAFVQDQQAGKVIVGLPISLDGSLGPQGQRVKDFAQALATRIALPVETWDERLSSVEASRRLKGRRAGKAAVDAVAATIILQAYLDSLPHHPGG